MSNDYDSTGTQLLQAMGLKLEMRRGIYGFYLFDPDMGPQRSRPHKGRYTCLTAARNGERPQPQEKQKS
jgi:hypothetical protein